MIPYRVFPTDKDGRTNAPAIELQPCHSDHAAMSIAVDVLPASYAGEVWIGERLVGVVKREVSA